MSNYRRFYVQNYPIFVTIVTHARQPWLANDATMAILRTSMQRIKTIHPFRHIAHVVLPDHIHWMFEPTGESTFSQIVAAFKREVTWTIKKTHAESPPQLPVFKLWQNRFYEHTIRDEQDFKNHLDYIHYNPVKHGQVKKLEHYNYSSFLEWKKRGIYEENWGNHEPLSIQSMNLE